MVVGPQQQWLQLNQATFLQMVSANPDDSSVCGIHYADRTMGDRLPRTKWCDKCRWRPLPFRSRLRLVPVTRTRLLRNWRCPPLWGVRSPRARPLDRSPERRMACRRLASVSSAISSLYIFLLVQLVCSYSFHRSYHSSKDTGWSHANRRECCSTCFSKPGWSKFSPQRFFDNDPDESDPQTSGCERIGRNTQG